MKIAKLSALIGIFFVVAPAVSRSQQGLLPRPDIGANADTNDATGYYDFGLSQVAKNPRKAADAFFWASRLNPTWAEPYYARRVAMHLQDNRRLIRYLRGDKGTIKSKDVQRIDSLYFYALTLNPFVYQKLDMFMLDAWIKDIADEASRSGEFSSGEAQYWLDNYLTHERPDLLAWRLYTEGRFEDAIRSYATAISKETNSVDRAMLRSDRARIFFQLNKPQSALPDLSAALDALRKADKKDLVYVYQSKALLEQSIGMTQLRLGNTSAAREAFGRALQEDLSYFPGHVQLAMLALDAKDPATAASEMDLAVQIRPDDPGLRYLYGFTLGMTGKPKDAEVQLRKAIELDPYYAAAHEVLAEALEAQQRPKDALEEYRRFLSLAAKTDARRADVEQRVKELASSGGG